MDSFDRQILDLLQQNCRLSTEKMGHQIGLSATACQRRIKKMRDDGIIEKEIAVVDGVGLGGFVTVIVEIELKQGGTVPIDQFKAAMLEYSEVQQCYYMAGSTDFIVIVTAANMREYEQLTRTLFLDNQNIKKFTSKVVMENIKLGLALPINKTP